MFIQTQITIYNDSDYCKEQKRPWSENWEAVTDESGANITTSTTRTITNEFFDVGDGYEGNDLRLRMTAKDDKNTASLESTKSAYAAAETDQDIITIRDINDSIHLFYTVSKPLLLTL